MSVLSACTYMYHVVPIWRPEEGIGSPGIRVTDDCELSRGCLESNPGLLQEQSVLLITGASPSNELKNRN